MRQFASRELPTDSEIHAMAVVLARRYGTRAGEIAQHFVKEHECIDDHMRAALWIEVYRRLSRMSAAPTLS